MSDYNGTSPAAPDTAWACESCGAALQFAAGTAALDCPYCGHRQGIAAVPRQVREHPFAELAQLPAKPMALPGGVKTFVCPGCRAVTESDALSDRCQFCATPLVADASLTERVVPEAVVPFALDRNAARDALRKWTSSRWFAPSSLKKVSEAETFKGTYLPHWTYDSDTRSDYRGERGEHYYVTETYTVTVNGQTENRTRQVRHTRWWPAGGTVQRFFDDVLVAGTTTVPEKQLDKLTPWPLEQAVPYQQEYLAGFQTLRYDVEPEPGLETAKQRMATVIEQDCLQDIGGDEQRLHRVDTSYYATAFKLLLLPVWFLTYLHAGKPLQVMVNARTGEVIGERPYSAAKISAAVLAALVVIGIVVAVLKLRSPH
ncbi:TFIIB-type zinc ribbon-containing protein [Streptacidiphilus sp. PAMC 29251]